MARQDDYVRYTIRVPADIYEWVQTEADKSGRSVNAEIVAILSTVIEEEKRKASSSFKRTSEDLENKPLFESPEELYALVQEISDAIDRRRKR